MCEPRRFFPFAGAGLMFWGASVSMFVIQIKLERALRAPALAS